MDGLKTFLYILLRDELPVGVVEKIVIDHVEKCRGMVVEFSNEFLAGYAQELTDRIVAASSESNRKNV